MPSPSSSADDPTVQLIHRFRRPVLILVFGVLVLGQLPRVASGDPWDIGGALLTVAFFAWLLWGLKVPGAKNDRDPDWWRRQALWQAKWAAAWLVVAMLWVGLAAVRDDFHPARLVSWVIPVLLLLSAAFTYRKRHRLAELASRKTDHWGTPVDARPRREEPPQP